jgi:hypothetical protein
MKSFDMRNLAKAFDRKGRDRAEKSKVELVFCKVPTLLNFRPTKSPISRINVCLKAIFSPLDRFSDDLKCWIGFEIGRCEIFGSEI